MTHQTHVTTQRLQALTELARAIACLGWRGGRVHEGLHQARKSMRRVRANLRLGEGVLGAKAAGLDRKLKDLLRDLSSLRDSAALIETLDRMLDDDTASRDELALIRRARRIFAKVRIVRMRTALADDPAFGRRRALLAAMEDTLSTLHWDRLTPEQISAAFARSARKASKAADRALASDRDEDWHRWRRRARRLSQQERILANLGGSEAGKRQEKPRATQLGEAQDFALLHRHCEQDLALPEADRSALGTLAKKRCQRLRQALADAYERSD